MSNGVIPQLFEMWRKSVLLTVGAISLGAEKVETSLTGWRRSAGRSSDRPERAPRVKVPVRASRVDARHANTRRVNARRATAHRATAARVGVKAAAHAPVEAPKSEAAPVASVQEQSAN